MSSAKSKSWVYLVVGLIVGLVVAGIPGFYFYSQVQSAQSRRCPG
ncbi:hypothetical protein [Metallosphaera hakonensis]|nr:hypothetical protein [Metallosphaera hakonensis]